MRYQSWDIILFPGGCHVPIQEFRTACFAVQQNGHVQIPNMITYIPTLDRGNPFTVSVHCWETPRFSPALGVFYGQKAIENAAWGVRVIIDGVCVASDTFSNSAAWPQLVTASDHPDPNGKKRPLLFPPFHKTVLSRRDWDISDDLGRIKVCISEGYRVKQADGQSFVSVREVVCFTFHPAPLERLERCNIAWPNPAMWYYPWRSGMTDLPKQGQAITISPHQTQYHGSHFQSHHLGQYQTPLKRTSMDSGYYTGSHYTGSSNMLPPPPRPTPSGFTNSLVHPFPDIQSHNSDSRTTSDGSMNEASLSLTGLEDAPMSASFPSYHQQPRTFAKVRLATDQIQEIVTALQATSKSSESAEKAPTACMTTSRHQRTATDVSMPDLEHDGAVHSLPEPHDQTDVANVPSIKVKKRGRSALVDKDPNLPGEELQRKISKTGPVLRSATKSS